MVLMGVLIHHRENLVLPLVNQRQIFAGVYITIMITVISFLIEKKSLSFSFPKKC